MTVAAVTQTYKFNLIDFDSVTWHDDEYENWHSVDAVLSSFFNTAGFTGVWKVSTAYAVGQIAVDEVDDQTYEVLIAHTSAGSGLFSADRVANPTFWQPWLLSHAGDTNNPHLTPVPNVLINGSFDFWQRGTTFTTPGLTADRMRITTGTGVSVTVTRQTNVLGTGESKFGYRWDQTAAGTARSVISQRLEGVGTFQNQTVTISVDTQLIAGTAAVVTYRATQNFGTGGAPSAPVIVAEKTIAVTGTRTRQSQTMAIPSITGKTTGTNGDDYLAIEIIIGQDVFTMELNDWQVVAGPVAAPFERRPLEQELALCQRYYEKSYDVATDPGSSVASGEAILTALGAVAQDDFLGTTAFNTKKRNPPTVTLYSIVLGTAGKVEALSVDRAGVGDAIGQEGFATKYTDAVGVAAGSVIRWQWTADAEL